MNRSINQDRDSHFRLNKQPVKNTLQTSVTAKKHTPNECKIPKSTLETSVEDCPLVSDPILLELSDCFYAQPPRGEDVTLDVLERCTIERLKFLQVKIFTLVLSVVFNLLRSFRVQFSVFFTRFECSFQSSSLVSSVVFRKFQNFSRQISTLNSQLRKNCYRHRLLFSVRKYDRVI